MRRHLFQTGTRAALVGAAVLVAASGVGAQEAGAQEYVRADCRPLVAGAAAAPSPASSLSARWYRRFWTGDCGGLSGCFGGSPNWNEVVGQLVARADASTRAAVLAKACRLGPVIGLEWTRPRDVRRIDSGDLRKFNSALASAHDVMRGLDVVETEARAHIARATR